MLDKYNYTTHRDWSFIREHPFNISGGRAGIIGGGLVKQLTSPTKNVPGEGYLLHINISDLGNLFLCMYHPEGVSVFHITEHIFQIFPPTSVKWLLPYHVVTTQSCYRVADRLMPKLTWSHLKLVS